MPLGGRQVVSQWKTCGIPQQQTQALEEAHRQTEEYLFYGIQCKLEGVQQWPHESHSPKHIQSDS